MKIYFAGSIRGGRGDQDLYASIISELRQYGTVLTEHVADKNLTNQGETDVTPEYIFKRDTKWLRECDLLVAEVTTPSLGVGYEIGYTESLDKPIVCLHRIVEGRSLSGMISGNKNLKVKLYKDLDDIKSILKKHFNTKK